MAITEQDYEARSWPEGHREELIEGRVIVLSPESRISEDLRWFVGSLMRFAADALGGKVQGPNFVMRLTPGLRRVPDLMFVRDPGRLGDTYLEGPCDLAVEIVSADSPARDWRDKFAEYEAAGVPEYLILDPLYQRAELYRLDDGRGYHRVPEQEGWLVSEALPGFRLRADWLKLDPLPNLTATLRELGLLD